MSWLDIEGHDAVRDAFAQALARSRLASTFLFVGPEGIGKRLFAVRLAQTLLCLESPPARMAPCGRCAGCLQVDSGTHPDLLRVERPVDRSEIPVRLLIGEGDRRLQEGLCHELSLKPFLGGRRVAIIDDADTLNEEGANCLLKTLEEPPPGSVLILIGTSPARQLPTIRSRSQIVRFAPLAHDSLARLLVREELAATPEDARRLALESRGSMARARELANPAWQEFLGTLLGWLARPPAERAPGAAAIAAFVEAAGKEAPLRRARLRLVLETTLAFQEQVLGALYGQSSEASPTLAPHVATALARGAISVDDLLAGVDRSLTALDDLGRNAHLPTLVDCWWDDLLHGDRRPQLALG